MTDNPDERAADAERQLRRTAFELARMGTPSRAWNTLYRIADEIVTRFTKDRALDMNNE